jgi:hypothetical protein
MIRRSCPEAQIPRAVFEHLRLRGAPRVFAFHPANGASITADKQVRNDHSDDGLWRIRGKRQVVYAKASLSNRDRLVAVSEVSDVSGPRSPSIDPLPSSSSPSAAAGARVCSEGDSEPLTSLTSLTGKSPVAEKGLRKSGHSCDHCGSAMGLLLQHGCHVDTLRKALTRNSDGSASGPLARVLDLLATEQQRTEQIS